MELATVAADIRRTAARAAACQRRQDAATLWALIAAIRDV